MSYEQYGINVESSEVIQAYLAENQYMTDLLRAHGVAPGTIDRIEEASQSVFDVRRMRAGRPVTIIKDSDSGEVQYFIYEKTDAAYVVFDLRDGVEVYERQKKIRIREREAGGTISISLYESIEAAKLELQLVRQLEEVYAWTVDFTNLDQGDFFKIVYEEQLVDGIPVGTGQILAAQIRQKGRDYYAFRFEQDTLVDYYDQQGRSLKRTFLQTPLDVAATESIEQRQHRYGTDYLAELGTPVLATGDGLVAEVGQDTRRGHYLTIRHNGLYATQYFYLQALAEGLEKGSSITQGQIIGQVGRYRSKGRPMLRYRFWEGDQSIPPEEVSIPLAPPIRPRFEIPFKRYQQMMRKRLEGISLQSSTQGQVAWGG